MTTTTRTGAAITPRSFFRFVAIAEAITWTMLIAGLLMKYVFTMGDVGDLAVRIGGTVHGFVFITYAATVVIVGLNQRWGIPLIALGVLTAVIPYATIPFDVSMDRRGRLEGGWRTEATDDRRDRNPIDRLLRWFLARPIVLAVVFVVAVVALFFTALAIGPPGGDR